MNPETQNRRKQTFNRVRGMMGMAMGVIYLLVAFTVVYFEQAGQIHIGKVLSYIIASLMFLYGIFRIYRGYKQMKGLINY